VWNRPLNQSLYLWAKTGLPIYILTMLGDRMAGADDSGECVYSAGTISPGGLRRPCDLAAQRRCESDIRSRAPLFFSGCAVPTIQRTVT
jgi:hypothetical protein